MSCSPDPVAKAWSRVAAALRPPPLEPLSTWLEANLRLPQGLAAEGGPIRLWPTQKGIADALADPDIERVTLVKSARSGFTTLLTGLVAHHVVNDPAPVLVVLPTLTPPTGRVSSSAGSSTTKGSHRTSRSGREAIERTASSRALTLSGTSGMVTTSAPTGSRSAPAARCTTGARCSTVPRNETAMSVL